MLASLIAVVRPRLKAGAKLAAVAYGEAPGASRFRPSLFLQAFRPVSRELAALAAPDEIFGVVLGGLGDVTLDVGLRRELLLDPAACLAL